MKPFFTLFAAGLLLIAAPATAPQAAADSPASNDINGKSTVVQSFAGYRF